MQKTAGFLSVFLFLGSSVIFAAPTSDQYLAAGDQFYQSKDFNKALLYDKAAVQTDPQNWKAYQSLGNCEYSLGQRENAVNDFQRSLNIHPNNPPLQNLMNQLSQTSSAPHSAGSLPDPNKWIWDVGVAGDLFDWNDLTNAYLPVTFGAPSSTPFGIEFNLGVDYTLSHNFQLGFQVQTTIKQAEYVSFNNSSNAQIFSETWLGGVLTARYLISLGSDLNLVFHVEGGFYGLVGSNLNLTNGSIVQIGSLNAANLGALFGLETEWIESGGWALDVGIGYRILTFSPVNYSDSTYGSGSATLTNGSGNNAYLDFSGPRVNVTVRLF